MNWGRRYSLIVKDVVLLGALLLLAGRDMAQGDTAEAVVARYLRLMNYDALPHDQMVEITSYAVDQVSPDDTCTVHRWFVYPNSYRVEVWRGGRLREGWHNDGNRRFRKYDTKQERWIDASQLHYYDHVTPYDFRGPLYHRATNGMTLTYGGEASFEGHPVLRVRTTLPDKYDRDYFFERESGLLFLFVEHPTSQGETVEGATPLDWRSIEEYLPVGDALMVSRESYQYQGLRTTVTHEMRLVPPTLTPFTKD